MKKIIGLLLLILVGFGLYVNHRSSRTTVEEEVDTTYAPKDTDVIAFMCKWAEEGTLSSEEIAHWDSMNEDGGFLLVRGAERNLDTIVNHLRMVFITEP